MAIDAPAATGPTALDQSRRRRERRFRLMASGALILMQTVAALGLGWDIQWHRWIGRDRFLTPPHLLIYIGVAGAGMLCIAVVLMETWRYWRRSPGVDDSSTIGLFRIFHAPRGFIVAGFGALTMAAAAPLDNYWHQLYGIDVTLWAPFHVMGLIGAGIGDLGAAYVLAAELLRSRREGTAGRYLKVFGLSGLALGLLFSLTALVRLVRVVMEPSIETFPTWHIGPLELLTSPVGLTLAIVVPSIAAAVVIRERGAATVMALMAALFTAIVTALAPIAVRIAGDAAQVTYRLPGVPHIQWLPVLLPFAYVVPALVVDIAYTAELRRWHRVRASLVAGLAGAASMTVIAVLLTLDGISSTGAALRILPATTTELPPRPTAAAVALGTALAVAVGVAAGRLGEQLGRMWRLSTQ
jgi:hypothetical protein